MKTEAEKIISGCCTAVKEGFHCRYWLSDCRRFKEPRPSLCSVTP